ncbi:MAG: serine--tRNA ligase, partial [Tissierellia bacterium]|nr:serine--tRNA ligase [Tissierellia bacterium]
MLDIRRIRKDPEGVIAALGKRHGDFPIDKVLELDEQRRQILVRVEEMRARQNSVSKDIPRLKKEGKDTEALLKEMKELSTNIRDLDIEVKGIDAELEDHLLNIPNTPHESVVEGETDEDNIEVRKWKEPTQFDFEADAHWDIGTNLDILDFERASKLTGARFTMFKGAGALLERALINFMLDVHVVD